MVGPDPRPIIWVRTDRFAAITPLFFSSSSWLLLVINTTRTRQQQSTIISHEYCHIYVCRTTKVERNLLLIETMDDSNHTLLVADELRNVKEKWGKNRLLFAIFFLLQCVGLCRHSRIHVLLSNILHCICCCYCFCCTYW